MLDNVSTKEAPATDVCFDVQLGDIWQCGAHRLMCDDSTDVSAVALLMQDDKASCLIADPPYGMSKKTVLNDHLRRDALVDFQRQWWNAYAPHFVSLAHAYVWGEAEELWRAWHAGAFSLKPANARQEIVWLKGHNLSEGFPGQCSSVMIDYPRGTERCLLIEVGRKGRPGNATADEFPTAFAAIRDYIIGERDRLGWRNADLNHATGTQMAGHWCNKSQWQMPRRQHYEALQAAAQGRGFLLSYVELIAQYENADATREKTARDVVRPYFDNTHEKMCDVWLFPRVLGAERLGHDTPKPVALLERIIRSSCPEGGIVAVPFGGTGPELIAAQRLGRMARVMELSPLWCGVMLSRWCGETQQLPVLVRRTAYTSPSGI